MNLNIATYKNLWQATKAVLRIKLISIKAYTEKEERFQISNIKFHLKILPKEQQTKPKASTKKEIIKTRAEINERLEKQ